MKRHSAPRSRPQGMTLVEMMVSLGLISAISLVLVLLYRSATVEFEHSAMQMALSQKARVVMDKIVPYASTAVPVNNQQLTFIYSPQVGSLTSQAATSYPNIYSLDFCTSIDFLMPGTTGRTDSFSFASSLNPRGTTGTKPAAHFRYRLRFVTADEATIKVADYNTGAISNAPGYAKNGQLVLEKMYALDPIPGSLPSSTLPCVILEPTQAKLNPSTGLPTYSGSSVPKYRLLGNSLNSVTFERKGNSINVRVNVSAVTRDGRLLHGMHERNNQGGRRDQSPNSTTNRERNARDYTLFSTVIIPYYTGR